MPGSATSTAAREAACDQCHDLVDLLDPHGAVGWLAINDVLATAAPDATGVFLATANPAKFRETVEPATGTTVPLPSVLAEAVARPRHSIRMDADYAALSRLLRS